MSLVKIQGNASGTGIFTIASPNSNTNRTLTLPDSTGTIATTADIPSTPTADVQTFDSTGTWTKPTGGQTMAKIQVWGGGGGGSRASSSGGTSGGGGGGYNELTVPLSFLAGSVTATVGAGGTGATATANGGAGGQSSFSLATSVNGRSDVSGYGGSGGGTTSIRQYGGNGGGPLGAGATITAGSTNPGTPLIATVGDYDGDGVRYMGKGGSSGSTPPMGGIYHGGGGATGGVAGGSLYGGGGGNATGGTGGVSLWGGSGGANAVGTAPGGGGGSSSTANTNGSAGGAGRIVVTSW